MIRYDRLPLIQGLLDYAKEKNARFHMPGHRNEESIEELSILKENLYSFDVTEVEGTDNLHYPEEIIARSQMLLTRAMGSKESLYCVNGSTAANYAMIFGLLKREETVLMQRNCHQSIYHAISLLELEPAYLLPEMVEDFNLPSFITLKELMRVHEANPKARAVILTSPTYHGMVTDISPLSEYCDRRGLYLLVDEAHGAHFPFSPLLPDSSLKSGAHASSVSFHKTLPSLTQGSVLNLSEKLTEEERYRIRHYHRVFQSSSPSYPLLASMEMARYYMEEKGDASYKSLLKEINSLKNDLMKIPGIRILGKKEVPLFDETRLVIKAPFPGAEMDRLLREEHQIQCEMTEGKNLIFILTPFDKKEDLARIAHALKAISLKYEKRWSEAIEEKPSFHSMHMQIPIRRFSENEVLHLSSEEVPLKEASGRVCTEKVVPYPPGIPLLLPGEVITQEILDALDAYYAENANILKSRSTEKDRIFVVKENTAL